MNTVKTAFEAGTMKGLVTNTKSLSFDPGNLTLGEQARITLNVLEGVEAFRASLPWYKRWVYCVGAAIKDLKELV